MAVLGVGLAGCGVSEQPGKTSVEDTGQAGGSLVIYSGHSDNVLGPLVKSLEEATGVKVEVRYGDDAQLPAQILAEGAGTEADLFFLKDASGFGPLVEAGRLQTLPQKTLRRVPAKYHGKDGTWVGVFGGVRVLVYDPGQVGQVPTSVAELVDTRWKGKVGYAPSKESFQFLVTAMRNAWGDQKTRQWLEAMKANGSKAYMDNTDLLDAVDRGEVALGLIQQVFWHSKVAEVGQDKVRSRIAFLADDDLGGIIKVTSVGIPEGSDRVEAARKAVAYLLSPSAQKYFAEVRKQYPLIGRAITTQDLPSLDSVQGTNMDLSDPDSLVKTQQLLREVGML
ncbi:MAG: extracellular solute-binding protein [Egibacteraceae bacterium]